MDSWIFLEDLLLKDDTLKVFFISLPGLSNIAYAFDIIFVFHLKAVNIFFRSASDMPMSSRNALSN